MRYVRYQNGGEDRWGFLVNDQLIQPLDGAPYEDGSPRGTPLPLNAVQLLAPCTPSKIVAVGKNYQDHIDEFDSERPANPILFIMPSTAVLAPDATLCLPPRSITEQVDYEGELAIVIGKKATRIKADQYADYVLGYTCLNDVTARDLQSKDGQWTRAKGMDQFAPVGPLVETELDPSDLQLRTRLNQTIVQESRTSLMIWKIPELLEFITAHITLLPGDVVATGTPAGVGPMKPGDRVEISIEGIGVLRTRIADTVADTE